MGSADHSGAALGHGGLTVNVAAPPVTSAREKSLSIWAKSCDDSLIATDTTRPRINLRDERLASRKEWGAYINLTTALHRNTAARADEIIAEAWTVLERSRRATTR